jgi:hypothetical protein
MADRITSKDKFCPRCKNALEYWISDDYYLKGKKFYSCDVCEWTPNDIKESKVCPNGCTGTVCSNCPSK